MLACPCVFAVPRFSASCKRRHRHEVKYAASHALRLLNSCSACACHTLQAVSSTDRSMIKHVELDVGDESFGSPTPPPLSQLRLATLQTPQTKKL